MDGHAMLVTEYCERGTMLDMIPSGGMLLADACRLFSQVVCSSFAFFAFEFLTDNAFTFQVSAVGYLHARGIVHGDIKPDNVFITRDGVAKLGDFGMAEHTGKVRFHFLFHFAYTHWQQQVLTRGRGTRAFNAPELLTRPSIAAHPAHDIWALGITYYAMLTGELPWTTAVMSDSSYRAYATSGNMDNEKWALLSGADKKVGQH